MAKYCLIKSLSDEFRKRLKSGEINPEKLGEMTSKERREYFESFLGADNAKNINTLFERKMLQKNRVNAMISWAKEVTGIKPAVKADIITKLEKMRDDPNSVLDAATEEKFLQDLASSKVGSDVTFEEAKAISDMTNAMVEAKGKLKDGMPDRSPEKLDYGAKLVALQKYLADLKLETVESAKSWKDIAVDVLLSTKGIVASLDNSAIGRQGIKVLWTHPGIWADNAAQSFKNIANSFKGEEVIDGLKAEIFSRENALNGKYKRMKLDIGDLEEAFPTTLPEKIPVFKHLYKASNAAYTGFMYKARADLADKLIGMAEKQGIDLTDPKEAESIGRLINSMTGRGNIGKLDVIGKEINAAVFSVKFFKSNLDALTAHTFDRKMTSFAKKEARKNIAKMVGGTALVLATADQLMPGSVEWDPRSSNFGKIKIGDTRFDVSGGMASIITLASRIAMQSTKSSSTGNIQELGSGFGEQNAMDLLYSFAEGKASPIMGVFLDTMRQETFGGQPVTLAGEVKKLVVPIPIQNAIETYKNENAAPLLMTIILDSLGIGASTYAPSSVNWNKDPGKELTQFREKVGKEKFEAANKEYNDSLSVKISKMKERQDYKNLSSDDKDKLITKIKKQEKETVFKKYRFSYKEEKQTGSSKSLDSMVRSLGR